MFNLMSEINKLILKVIVFLRKFQSVLLRKEDMIFHIISWTSNFLGKRVDEVEVYDHY